MQAVKATFLDFPALTKRRKNERIIGFHRTAATVPMYRIERICSLPPQIRRLPLNLPLSQLKGATPTRAEIFLPLIVPNSGKPDKKDRDTTDPTPGVLWRSFSFCFQTSLRWIRRLISRSTPSSCLFNHSIWSWIPWATSFEALRRRFFSAVIMMTNCRRRAISPSSALWASSGRDLTSGRILSANLARTWASIRSVLARIPWALAKSRTWRGLITAAGNFASCSFTAKALSNPPLASMTIRLGLSLRSSWHSCSFPASSCTSCQVLPVGWTPMSRWSFETSIPTNSSLEFIDLPLSWLLARPCEMRDQLKSQATVRA